MADTLLTLPRASLSPSSTVSSASPSDRSSASPGVSSPAADRLGWFGHWSQPRVDDRSLSLGRDFHETIGQLLLEEFGLQHAAHIIVADQRLGLLGLFGRLRGERYTRDRRVDVVVTNRNPFPFGDACGAAASYAAAPRPPGATPPAAPLRSGRPRARYASRGTPCCVYSSAETAEIVFDRVIDHRIREIDRGPLRDLADDLGQRLAPRLRGSRLVQLFAQVAPQFVERIDVAGVFAKSSSSGSRSRSLRPLRVTE